MGPSKGDGVAKPAAGSSKSGGVAKPGTTGASAGKTSGSQSLDSADGGKADTLRIRGRNFLHKKNGTQAEHLVHHGLLRMRDCLTARSWRPPAAAEPRKLRVARPIVVTADEVEAIWTELQQHMTRVDLETGGDGAPVGEDRAPEGAGNLRPVGNLIECRFSFGKAGSL